MRILESAEKTHCHCCGCVQHLHVLNVGGHVLFQQRFLEVLDGAQVIGTIGGVESSR